VIQLLRRRSGLPAAAGGPGRQRCVRRCRGTTTSGPGLNAWWLAIACLTWLLGLLPTVASAQDYQREARWAQTTLATLDQGDPVYLTQARGHRFLGLWLTAQQPRGAVLVVHGRGWAPDYELYGALRTLIAERGWSTLAIQMPVLDGTGKMGDYVALYPDAIERIGLAVDWLHAQGIARVAIVSHSLGATMANQYLIRHDDGKVNAWVYLSILNGLEDMFRIHIPVLDVYAEQDWEVIKVGADERRKQIVRNPGSDQVMFTKTDHFFEGQWPQLSERIVRFLDQAIPPG
jgi:pimeloyl-ACP methyl ester carboxylesterase